MHNINDKKITAFDYQYIDNLSSNVDMLKSQITKETMSLKVQYNQLHDRSEKLRTYVDEATSKLGSAIEVKERADQAYGKVVLLEEKNEKQFAAVKELLKKVLGEKKS